MYFTANTINTLSRNGTYKSFTKLSLGFYLVKILVHLPQRATNDTPLTWKWNFWELHTFNCNRVLHSYCLSVFDIYIQPVYPVYVLQSDDMFDTKLPITYNFVSVDNRTKGIDVQCTLLYSLWWWCFVLRIGVVNCKLQ